jgi:4-carboxymuconolactone decarboxylase
MANLPFDPDQLTAADRALYESMVTRRKEHGAPFDGPYAALMNHPQLCKRIEELGFYLKFEGHLPRNVYQFVVLSVACQTGAAFEWADHVEHARAAGVPEPVIETLHTQGVLKGSFPAPYTLAAQILAVTLPWKNIPEEVQAAAISAYGMEGFIELVVLSGFYQMFSTINEGFDVKPKAAGSGTR